MSPVYTMSLFYDIETDKVYQSQSYNIVSTFFQQSLVYVTKKDIFYHKHTIFEYLSYISYKGNKEFWTDIMDNNPLLHFFDIDESIFISLPPEPNDIVSQKISSLQNSNFLLGERNI